MLTREKFCSTIFLGDLMVVGTVARNQVLMFMSFDEEAVEFVTESLAHSLEIAYQTWSFFSEDDSGVDPWEEE